MRFLFLGTSTVIVGAVLLVSPLVAPPGVIEAVAREIREITSVWTSNYPHERTWACRGGLMPTLLLFSTLFVVGEEMAFLLLPSSMPNNPT